MTIIPLVVVVTQLNVHIDWIESAVVIVTSLGVVVL